MLKTASVALPVLLLACGQPFFKQPPTTRPLPAKDSRQALVGKWSFDLTLDSVQRLIQEPHGVRSVMDPVPSRTVRGTLELRDTVVGLSGTDLRSVITFDFEQLLGHQLSCFTPSRGLIQIDRSGDHVTLSVTPGAADCGFFAEGHLAGDSIVGSWAEGAFVGSPAAGRLHMVRSAP